MLTEPTIVETSAQASAVIRLTIPRSEIQNSMGPAFQELMGTIAAQGIAPTGAAYSHHFRFDPDVFDFEVGVPVSAPVQASGRVVPGELPAATVARTYYQGPYEGLGPAWGEFGEWLASHGYDTQQSLWESYVEGPGTQPDPTKWRTELNRPLNK
ncbi:MAG: GyrI-like domain-containing protein ['Candidatus Kapabacteria' thiocyanatum]|uniref:AraC family transcriptional regulator n=1 Tax=Candidatus Kapaibacterium thiocyanatum TaxID=1895771 RepID=A0A1M3KZ08_9BACT|nr:GyrI-like domain-containing protein ['Candidatus Kapabacteria' thiocyanatum]OJX57610.1 MAG: AraC family transcriptional regulator ['Candidatus Kapabacteria' thiocyanatum]